MSHRAEITLTDEQYARLRQEAQRTGLSLAELVRRAIDDRDEQALSTEERLQALADSFGAWQDRAFDGEQYVDAVRHGIDVWRLDAPRLPGTRDS